MTIAALKSVVSQKEEIVGEKNVMNCLVYTCPVSVE